MKDRIINYITATFTKTEEPIKNRQSQSKLDTKLRMKRNKTRNTTQKANI